MKQECSIRKTSIGGQALIEGIMMRGPKTSAMAVRKPDGSLEVETWDTYKNGGPKWYTKVPFLRGSFNFVASLTTGYRCLMRSAEIAQIEEEPSGWEKKMKERFGDRFYKMMTGVIMVVAVVIALALFFFLPTYLVSFLGKVIENQTVLSWIESLTKIAIFLTYIVLVSRTPDIRRTFQYHGAEHKTIACYEAGEELTVENIRKHIRFHPRCGTSFIVIVLIVSAIVFSLVSWDNLVIRILLKLAMLPITVGISYELIKFAGRHDNLLTKIVSAPGLWLQRLTTKEPEDDQIEAAIEAMVRCIPEEEGLDQY